MCLSKGKVLIKNVCEHNSMIDETYSKEISKALLGRMDRSKIFIPYLLFTSLFSSYTNRQHQPTKRNGQIDRNTTDKKSLSMKHIHSAFRKDIFEPPLTESKILAYSF